MQPVTMVHTSDLGEVATELVGTRPRVFPHLVGAVRALRPDVLTDGGDALPAIAAGDPGWAWLADMAYGAWVPGNHDLDLGPETVLDALNRTGVPVVAANLRAGSWSAPATRILLGGRVGLTGVARPRRDGSWVVSEPMLAVATATEELRGVDIVVLLSHLGADRDVEIVRQTGGIDLVLSGHVHQALREPFRAGTTPVVQVGANGRYIGLVRGVPGAWDVELVDPRTFPPDSALTGRLRARILKRWPALGEVLADLPISTAGGSQDAQWPLADWAADAVRAATGADAAILARSSIEPEWTPGPVTYGDICNLYHHDEDPLVVLTLDAPSLAAALEELGNDRFFAVAGLRAVVDGTAPEGSRVRECLPTSVSVTAAVGEVRVAMTRHRARFARPLASVETGLTVREALAAAARAQGRLRLPDDRRVWLRGGMPPPPRWAHVS